VQLVNVQNNNIWLTGKGGGLKELTQPRLSQQLNQYYEGVNQSAAFRNRPPQDLHEDPEIVSFIESEPGFLCVAAGSTSAAARIGGCTAPAPTLAGATAWQGVLNGDFSAGMWAWQGHSFPDNPGATRLPIWHRDSTTWSVVADGCAKGKSPCARIQTKTIANGTVASTRFRSSAFDITRTRHGMNLRCAHKRFRSPSKFLSESDRLPRQARNKQHKGERFSYSLSFSARELLPSDGHAAGRVSACTCSGQY
jgi:hypothetical protein